VLPEDGMLIFTNLSVTDVDAGSGAMLTTISVTNGVLFLSSTNGLAFVRAGTGPAV